MIDHLTDSNLEKTGDAVIEASSRNDIILRVIKWCCARETSSNTMQCKVDHPKWIDTSLTICHRVINNIDFYKDLLSHKYPPALQTALLVEILGIHKALTLRKEAAYCGNLEEKKRCWTSLLKEFVMTCALT